MKKWIAGLAFLIICVGIGWRLYIAYADRQYMQKTYPFLEQLLAVYSVTSWSGAGQEPPVVDEDSEWGGQNFVLSCPAISWGEEVSRLRGDILDCFLEVGERTLAFDGSKVMGPQLSASGDYFYDFRWESVFGYELDLNVVGSGETGVLTDEECRGELDARGVSNGLEYCSFQTYDITVSGLRASESFVFTVVNGWIEYDDALNPNRREEWIFWIGELGPYTLGELNRLIQRIFRELGLPDTKVSQVAPRLEVSWLKKDREFVTSLIEASSDVGELTKYLEGSK